MSTRKSLSGPNREPILRANDSKRPPQLVASFFLSVRAWACHEPWLGSLGRGGLSSEHSMPVF
jgi:hypothetical protein